MADAAREAITVELGGDSYCETCGYSWNHVTFDPDRDGAGQGYWDLSYRVGCTGGQSTEFPDAEAAIAILDHLETHFDDVDLSSIRSQLTAR